MKRCWCILCAVCVTAAPLYADFSISQITAIPPHPYDVGPTYYHINNQGYVVGNEHTGSALLWHAGEGFVTMPSQGIATTGYAINNHNQICGSYATKNFDARYAFTGSMTEFTDLRPNFDDNRSLASGINDSGQVVGSFYASDEGYWDSHSYLWDEGTVTLIENGNEHVWAHSINNQGQVVGLTQAEGQYSHLFVWEQDRGIRTYGFNVYHGSTAKINEAGHIIYAGYIIEPDKTTNLQLLWGQNTFNVDNNNHGIVVGTTQGRQNELWPEWHAMLWTRQSGLIDLNSLLPAGSQWQCLTGARSINDHNQILGRGILANGETAYFVADIVPEPATVVLLGFGAWWMGGPRRRRFSAYAC